MKIFNLGLFKTGTTSLHLLMKELNFKSWHELNITKHTIEELKKEFTAYDCYLGSLTYRYKDIYEAVPDAKYILTTRDSHSWLKSARKQFRETSDDGIYWMGKEVFIKLFGTDKLWKLSDKELIHKYNKINEEIKDFFKDKENFIELNFIDSTDKKTHTMKKLLKFLEINWNVSAANLEFPHSNKGVR